MDIPSYFPTIVTEGDKTPDIQLAPLHKNMLSKGVFSYRKNLLCLEFEQKLQSCLPQKVPI